MNQKKVKNVKKDKILPAKENQAFLIKAQTACLSFNPTLQISRQTLFLSKSSYKVIEKSKYEEIPDFSKEEKMKEAEKKTNSDQEMEWGLDCSGQGICQPDIEPSTGEEMHDFLGHAVHDIKRKEKKERKKQKKED